MAIRWSLTRGLKKCRKIINRQAQKVVAVAYRRWLFTRGSNFNSLTGKILVFWSLMGDGCLRRREVVVHGGSTVPQNVTGRREASEYSQKRQFFSISVSK